MFNKVTSSSTTGTLAVILITLSYYGAYFGYSIASQFVGIGGIFQNPVIILLNYLTFDDYEKYNLTNYVTAGILFFTGVTSFFSVVKMASLITIIQIFYSGGVDQSRIFMVMCQIVGGVWLPEFMYYVLPTIATSGYMLSMTL